MTRPLARSHLASPAATNWSMIALRAVGEVAELRFPQHQRLRIGERIAIFEAEHAEFGQRAVAHLEAAAFDVAQRDIFVAGLLVDPDGVALAEGAAAAVLARQADALPSASRLPNASASAVAQSKPSPLSNIAFFASRMRCSVLWMCEALGNGRQDLAELAQLRRRRSRSAMLRRPSTGSSGRPSPAQRPSNQSALLGR